jgi:hypothetical protein
MSVFHGGSGSDLSDINKSLVAEFASWAHNYISVYPLLDLFRAQKL